MENPGCSHCLDRFCPIQKTSEEWPLHTATRPRGPQIHKRNRFVSWRPLTNAVTDLRQRRGHHGG